MAPKPSPNPIRSMASKSAEDHFLALKGELEIKMSRLRYKKNALEERRQSLSKRRHAIISMKYADSIGDKVTKGKKRLKLENGTYSEKFDEDDHIEQSVSNIIRLNVGGKYMFVSRETLTTIRESRLAVLFNGRNDEKIMSDEEGCIFLDINPIHFEKILSYLYEHKEMNKAGESVRQVKIPDIPNEREELSEYLQFFGLQKAASNKDEDTDTKEDEKITVKQEGRGSNFNSFDAALENELNELELKNRELNAIESSISKDESFIHYFRARKFNGEEARKDHALHLYLQNGETITVKRSTLCIFKKSRIAKDFRDDAWIAKNSFQNDDGKNVVLIDHPSAEFKKIVNILRIRAIVRSDKAVPSQFVPNNTAALHKLIGRLLPGRENYIKKIDSDILTTKCYDIITSWLCEANIKSKPHLLYRASSNGWTVKDFHAACDGKGSTLTIVKTVDGYTFGGYSDRSWHGVDTHAKSKQAFLCTLKCHADLKPTKMKIRPSQYDKAVYPARIYGPTFGDGHDLWIGTDGKSLKKGSSTITSYEGPADVTASFLTGSHDFDVAEVEVFKC